MSQVIIRMVKGVAVVSDLLRGDLAMHPDTPSTIVWGSKEDLAQAVIKDDTVLARKILIIHPEWADLPLRDELPGIPSLTLMEWAGQTGRFDVAAVLWSFMPNQPAQAPAHAAAA